MNQVSRNATVSRKIDRSSYRRPLPFGIGILPLTPPAAPILTPSQLAADIKALLASSQELGRRQDALMAAIRNPLPPIAGGALQDHSDADLEEMYVSVQWLDRLDAMHRDPADQLL